MKLHAPTAVDGYKISHADMYADGTTKVNANLTPRSDRIYRRTCTQFYSGKLLWVGAQGAVQEIHEMWQDFFAAPKEYVVGRFAARMQGYLGGYDSAVRRMEALHDLGYLPLEFKSLPEGALVRFGTPVLTVENTLPAFYWLTNYHETVVSDLTWKSATNATIAMEYRAMVDHYGDLTGTDMFSRAIQCHDFSMRGMSGPEDAARSGFGHLLSFIGTDTLPAMDYAQDYYDAKGDELIAISVPATEHAVATSNILYVEQNIKNNDPLSGKDDRLVAEAVFMKDLITRKFPTGIVSYVADSYDFYGVLTEVLPSLKDVIMAREASAVAPGKLVIRPDSGDPVKVICGHGTVEEVESLDKYAISDAVEGNEADVILFEGKYYLPEPEHEWQYDECCVSKWNLVEVSEAEVKGAVEVLWEIFGGTTTEKGYKLLDSHIGLIYGDSITTKRAEEILRRLADKGFASGNVVFGVGSYCVTPETPILCDDFVWRKAGELKVGQGIIAFDENPTYGQGRKPSRRYVRGEITVNNQEVKKCVEVQCGDRKLKCSYDHPVMVMGSLQARDDFYTNKPDTETVKALNMPRGKGLIWKKAGELVAGDMVAYFGDPWDEEDSTRSTGWLEGMYDGEGSLYTGYSGRSISAWKVSISQNKGEAYERIHRELKNRGFSTYETARKCPHIVLTGGFYEHARFLGTVRPQRLLDKAATSMSDLPALKQNYTYKLLEVTGVVDIGMQGISSITTSVGTFITGGFLTHNTYQCNTRDTFGFAVKATYTEVDGEGIAIFKDPKTDSGKKSAKGLLFVGYNTDGGYVLQDNVSVEEYNSPDNKLQTIYKDGKFVKRTSLAEIRARLDVIKL